MIDEFPELKWMVKGNCHGIDIATQDLYDPSELGQLDAAETWCFDCPVKKECLKFALDNNEIFGTWGGTTEDQRKAIRMSKRNGSSKKKLA